MTADLSGTNRVLVVDDDETMIDEYEHCLSPRFRPDMAATTITDLEKVLFGEETDERGAARFEVHSRRQGEDAVEAVLSACKTGQPYAIVFIDVRMPPGMDGIEAAKRIREIDPNVNIVVVTGSIGSDPRDLGELIPPADKIFFFKKPFHAIECRQLTAAICGKWHSDLALRRANEELELRVAERTEDLRKLAFQDPVTGLPNQLQLTKELQAMIDASNKGREESAVVLFDIDRFSFLNETMGYERGTELLRGIGARLEKTMERLDLSDCGIIGRFGADEFACIATGVNSDEKLRAMAEGIEAAVERPFVINGRDVYLKAAFGVAWHPQHGRDARTVFRCAEAALHRSMRGVQGGITYYHSEMQNHARDKFDLEGELRNAIENGEIVCYYQPQLSLDSGQLGGVEALARWVRPDGSIVPPGDFVPLSEEMGISDLLFEAVLDNICDSLDRWQDERDWSVPVSVNVSAHQLGNGNFPSFIRDKLAAKKIHPWLINLELTETTLLEDLNAVKPMLDQLADFGVGLHIDDFGTGYSSLSYLAELPVQTMKIDRSFTGRITESRTIARVVQAIIALGKALQLNIVAEGVETEQQLLLVNQLSCELAQGYFIGKPMPENEFLDWCAAVSRTTNNLPALSELSITGQYLA